MSIYVYSCLLNKTFTKGMWKMLTNGRINERNNVIYSPTTSCIGSVYYASFKLHSDGLMDKIIRLVYRII